MILSRKTVNHRLGLISMNIYCFPFKADFYARKLLYPEFKLLKKLTNSIIKCFLFRYQGETREVTF